MLTKAEKSRHLHTEMENVHPCDSFKMVLYNSHTSNDPSYDKHREADLVYLFWTYTTIQSLGFFMLLEKSLIVTKTEFVLYYKSSNILIQLKIAVFYLNIYLKKKCIQN